MAEKTDHLLLCAGGDVALGGMLEGHLQGRAACSQWVAAVRPLFAAADIGFVDLDCSFDADGASPATDGYRITASVGQLDLLAALGVDIVSQANNHAFDQGWRAVQQARAELLARGVESVGAGADLSAARQATVLQRRGGRVGFLAYASAHPWVDARPATVTEPGVAPLDAEIVREDIARLRAQVDWVVVSTHWGKEYLHYPAPTIMDQGRSFLEAGASVVLGHHPHVVQGVEEYGGGVIAYSLGNFIFPDYPGQGLHFTGAERDSVVLCIRLHTGGAELDAVHFVRMGTAEQPLWLLRGQEEEQAREALRGYSWMLRQPRYAAFWQRQARQRELARLRRVWREEVWQAGWGGGVRRLLRLGRKNLKSVARSLGEIVFRPGRHDG